MLQESEYARAGVDYKKIQPFKQVMRVAARRTHRFPNARQVFIPQDVLHAHGGMYEYWGNQPHGWCKTQEGLGNKNWIAELMYQQSPSGPTYHDTVMYDTTMMAANDVIAQGAMPVVYTDEVAASDSGWFADERRAQDCANGVIDACRDAGMALVAGESPAYTYLINPRAPVKSAAVFGGTVTGIIAPRGRLITGQHLAAGDRIIGVRSRRMHANGASLVIRRVMGDRRDGIKPLKDGFYTKLPSGTTLGEAAMERTLCYVPLIEALLVDGTEIHALLPGTGDGVAKLAFDERPFTYYIHTWPAVDEFFLYFRELGVSIEDCLKTFNWSVGYYLFVPAHEVDHVLSTATHCGFEALVVGEVREGTRCTIFGPEGDLVLPPPGE